MISIAFPLGRAMVCYHVLREAFHHCIILIPDNSFFQSPSFSSSFSSRLEQTEYLDKTIVYWKLIDFEAVVGWQHPDVKSS
jgi:hypothetical protein